MGLDRLLNKVLLAIWLYINGLLLQVNMFSKKGLALNNCEVTLLYVQTGLYLVAIIVIEYQCSYKGTQEPV